MLIRPLALANLKKHNNYNKHRKRVWAKDRESKREKGVTKKRPRSINKMPAKQTHTHTDARTESNPFPLSASFSSSSIALCSSSSYIRLASGQPVRVSPFRPKIPPRLEEENSKLWTSEPEPEPKLGLCRRQRHRQRQRRHCDIAESRRGSWSARSRAIKMRKFARIACSPQCKGVCVRRRGRCWDEVLWNGTRKKRT